MPSPMLTIMSELLKLSHTELQNLYEVIKKKVTNISTVTSLMEKVREQRFLKGIICPHFNSDKVVRNGKYKGKQRYIFRNCNKSFGDLINSIISNTKKSCDKWHHYVKCMIKGYSLRKMN